MKIVIDIPEKYLNFEYNIIDVTLFTGVNNTITDVNVEDECAEFQVLPKGHGRLIDADALVACLEKDTREAFTKHQVWLMFSVYNECVPTVVKADKEKEK